MAPISDFYCSPETLSTDVQCLPGFFEARDAIIQADQVLTGGENFCDLCLDFAEKELGMGVTVQGRTPWGGGIRAQTASRFRLYVVPRRFLSRLQNCRPGEDYPQDDLPWES